MSDRRVLLCLGLAMALCAGCTETPAESAESGSEAGGSLAADPAASLCAYCAKEDTAENRIFFQYPQLPETEPQGEHINEQIAAFVEGEVQLWLDGAFSGDMQAEPESWDWEHETYTHLSAIVEYTVTRNDTDYFSVTWDGFWNAKGTPHPTNYFSALTFDAQTGAPAALTDLCTVDTAFVQLVQEEAAQQWQAEMGETTAIHHLQDALTQEKLESGSCPIYLTDTALGISIDLVHPLGDHFEVELPLAEVLQ